MDLSRVVHKSLKIFLADSCSRGVIGEAEIDQIRLFLRKLRNEIVLGKAGHIDYSIVILIGRWAIQAFFSSRVNGSGFSVKNCSQTPHIPFAIALDDLLCPGTILALEPLEVFQ